MSNYFVLRTLCPKHAGSRAKAERILARLDDTFSTREEWLDWTVPGLDNARELDDIDIQMMCQPQVTIRTAPTLP